MALSYVKYSGDGDETDFTVSFPYLSRSHISVLVDGDEVPFTWLSASEIRCTTAPLEGALNVKVKRTTPKAPLTTYSDSAGLRARDMNLIATQQRYVTEELFDAINDVGTVDGDGGGNVVSNFAYDITDESFGAIGDGVSRSLSESEAAVINAQFASYGLQGDYAISPGDEKDEAALISAMYSAAHTGKPVFIPAGIFKITKPKTLYWDDTPPNENQPGRPAVCKIYGVGIKSIIMASGIAADRAVFEMLGRSNGESCNIKFSDLLVEHDETCDVGSYCFRVGDAWTGWGMDRVVMQGANGALIRTASSDSWAQLGTLWQQCTVKTNYLNRWGDEDETEVYAVQVETDGAFWDNCQFISCTFNGTVVTRANICKFLNCQFYTQSQRPLGTFYSNHNIVCLLGSLDVECCHFEDHLTAIRVGSVAAPCPMVRIVGNIFAGVQNFGGPTATYAIVVADGGGDYRVGSLDISGNAFRDEGYSIGSIFVPSVCGKIGPNTRIGVAYTGLPITIVGDGGERILEHHHDLDEDYDTLVFTDRMRPKIPKAVGPFEVVEDTVGQASSTINNPDADQSACLTAKCGTALSRLIVFGQDHPTFPGKGYLGTIAAGDFAVGTQGGDIIRLEDTTQRAWVRELVRLGGVMFEATASSVINTSAAELSVVPTGVGTVVVPANKMLVGSGLEIEASGWITTIGAETITIRIKVQGITVASKVITIGGAVGPVGWSLKAWTAVRVAGASGSHIGHGTITFNDTQLNVAAFSTAALDTTASALVDVTAQQSVSDVGNEIVTTNVTVKVKF